MSSIERTTLEKSIDVGIPNLVSDGSSIIISDKALTNIAPRIRMTILYAIAQSLGYRVAGTGRSDEENFGFTYQELDVLIEKMERLDRTGHLKSPFTEIESQILKLHENAYHKDHVIKIF